MPPGRAGTPYLERQVVRINGQPYFLVAPGQEKNGMAKRQWVTQRIPDQGAQLQPIHIMLDSFHQGSGFTYHGMDAVYDYANGWDASSPGRLSTYARLATCAPLTFGTAPPANHNAQIIDLGGGYFAVMAGQELAIYQVNMAGGTWSAVTATTFTNYVAGRVSKFNGDWYIPMMTSTGAPAAFQQWAPAPPAIGTFTAGPAAPQPMCFTTWTPSSQFGPVLVGAQGNAVYTCAATPTTGANWSAGTQVDVPDYPITDLATYDTYVVCRNTRGLWTFNENLQTINEIPDLQSFVSYVSSQGMSYAQGYLVVPHVAGLVRWRPGAWMNVGPEQEHALEGAVSQGWGPVNATIANGQWLYALHNDPQHGTGAIVGYGPGRGSPFQYGSNMHAIRGPVITHCYQQCTGTYNGIGIVQDATGTYSLLVTCQVSANRLTWTPNVFQIPRAGMAPGDDPLVSNLRDTADFYTSRYFDPSRQIQKTYESVDFWLDVTAANGPGVQLWASINNGSFFQLLDSNGNPATASTTGFYRFFFPTTAQAVGNFVQLDIKVPALGGGQTDQGYTFREGAINAGQYPITTDSIQATFELNNLRLPDGSTDPRTIQQMETDLLALCGPQAAAVAYSGPNGEQGFVQLVKVQMAEAEFQEGSVPVRVAQVEMVARVYSLPVGV